MPEHECLVVLTPIRIDCGDADTYAQQTTCKVCGTPWSSVITILPGALIHASHDGVGDEEVVWPV